MELIICGKLQTCYNKPKDEVALSQTQTDFLKDIRKREKKAFYIIYQALDDDGFEMISNATTSKKHGIGFEATIKEQTSKFIFFKS